MPDEKHQFEFDIGSLLPLGLTIIVLGIALAFGLEVMGELKEDQMDAVPRCGLNTTGGTSGTIYYDNCSAAYNATEDAIIGVAKIPEKLPLVVTVVIAAVIISVIVGFLMYRGKSQ